MNIFIYTNDIFICIGTCESGGRPRASDVVPSPKILQIGFSSKKRSNGLFYRVRPSLSPPATRSPFRTFNAVRYVPEERLTYNVGRFSSNPRTLGTNSTPGFDRFVGIRFPKFSSHYYRTSWSRPRAWLTTPWVRSPYAYSTVQRSSSVAGRTCCGVLAPGPSTKRTRRGDSTVRISYGFGNELKR